MRPDRTDEFHTIIEWAAGGSRPPAFYASASDTDLITVAYYNNLLTCQAACMISLRTFAVLATESRLAEEIARTGGLGLQDILRWRRDLSERQLYEAYCLYPDPMLIGFMAVLKIDEAVIRSEMTRRLADKPVAQQFILLDYGGLDSTEEVRRLLKVKDIPSYRLSEQDSEDIQQSAFLSAKKSAV